MKLLAFICALIICLSLGVCDAYAAFPPGRVLEHCEKFRPAVATHHLKAKDTPLKTGNQSGALGIISLACALVSAFLLFIPFGVAILFVPFSIAAIILGFLGITEHNKGFAIAGFILGSAEFILALMLFVFLPSILDGL